ncbi:MAG: hypothetical protein II796_00765 [Oscillospiraceae bacterium]|nr:hypothetical protein [Oscillospiraceae bacterium]
MNNNKFSVDEILEEVRLRNIKKSKDFSGPKQEQNIEAKTEPTRLDIPFNLNSDLDFDKKTNVEAAEISATTKETLQLKRETVADEFVQNSNINIENDDMLNEALNDFKIADTYKESENEQNQDDINYIEKELNNKRKTVFWELILSTGSFVVLFWLFLVNTMVERLPTFLQIIPSQVSSALVEAAFLIISVILSSDIILDGFSHLLKFKANCNSLISLAVVGAGVQIGFAVTTPYLIAQKWNNMYGVVVAAVLVCFQFNKYIRLKIACQNTLILQRDKKFTIKKIASEPANRLDYIMGQENSNICLPVPVKEFNGVLDKLEKPSYFDKISRYISPCVIVLAVAMLGYLLFKKSSWIFIETALAGLLIISAPMLGNLSSNMFLLSLSKRLKKAGAGIYSLNDLDTLKNVERVVVRSEDILAPTHMQLLNMELFKESDVDLAILGTASILKAAKVEIASLFIKMLAHEDMLEDVESLNIEGDMGFSGWWQNKRILFGTRGLMINHGVRTPSREFEKMHLQNEPGEIVSRALYIALDGALLAMFIIGHKPLLKAKRALSNLQKNKIVILLTTNDATLSADNIITLYNLDQELFELVPQFANGLLKEEDMVLESAPAEIILEDRLFGLASAVNLAARAQNTAKVSTFIQCLGLLLGIALLLYFVLNGHLELMSGMNMLVYNILWSFICILLPSIKGI